MSVADWLSLEPADFEKKVRLVFTSRRPYSDYAKQLKAAQSVRLVREPGNPADSSAILVVTTSGSAVGYLDADTAAFMAVLLDSDAGIQDKSVVEQVLLKAPEGDEKARRMRYPRVFVKIRIRLERRWPMMVIAAVLGVKSPDFKRRFCLDLNPWLKPIEQLHRRYLKIGHDRFTMPKALVAGWKLLTADENTHEHR